MKQTKPISFAAHLKELRLKAGLPALSMVVELAKQHKNDAGIALSKAKLSQYERGAVDTIKPETLRLLAALYKTNYEQLAERWFNERYQSSKSRSKSGEIEISITSQFKLCSEDNTLTVIDLGQLQLEQSKVPDKSVIIVSANRFLDDTVFFEMVAKNIRRGVTYYYLLPESRRYTYRNLVAKLAASMSCAVDKIDKVKTFFIPRWDFDFFINRVLHISPNGHMRGYIGFLNDESPVCYQAVEERLAMRLFESLLWTIRVAGDRNLRVTLSQESESVAMQGSGIGTDPISLVRASFS